MEALIEKLSKKGYGICGKKEIAHTVPGDLVLHQKGRLLEVLNASPNRVETRCAHASTCGGCCWQQMSYEAQLAEKQSRVEQAFGSVADPILSSPELFSYRNKMEFSFSENRAGMRFLGLMIAQTPYVFDLHECHLVSPWFSQTLTRVRSWWENSGLKAYYPPKNEGSLRHITFREAKHTGERMVALNVSGNPEFALTREHLDRFVEAVGGETAIFLRIHQAQKGSPTRIFEMHLAGPDHIVEELHIGEKKLQFKISPASFFQPNTLAAEMLYQTALAMLPTSSTVYDLYCGTGTLGMIASFFAQEVIGIEWSPEAVIDAEENLKRNEISNMRVYQGDVGKVLSTLQEAAPDAVIVDPPRIGLDALALSHLKMLQPKYILYISCNPLTQAENVRELIAAGYELKRLQPVDQFPHTYHIENIAFLAR